MTEADIESYWESVARAAEYLEERISGRPEIGVMTGTGLGGAAGCAEAESRIPYSEIPEFPVSTVRSHAGRLMFTKISGKRAMVMQGRFHLYEGYHPRTVTLPVRVMQALGVDTLIVTNAAGGLSPDFMPGNIMAITDHINLTGETPLAGPNHERWGPRFPDMSAVYSRKLIDYASKAGQKAGIELKRGVYMGLKGPSLETPAETRFIRQAGADAVGLSTIQEVIAAVHAGMDILGLSVITNVNDPDRQEPATVEQIIEVAERSAPFLEKIITGVAEEL
ncbi:MAG: purine-nucleoside phosphorylase [Desulfosalsimonas sp.]